jgi:hypothetical protein
MGSRGVWLGMLISNVLAAILALILLATVDWHHKVIEQKPAALEEPILSGVPPTEAGPAREEA